MISKRYLSIPYSINLISTTPIPKREISRLNSRKSFQSIKIKHEFLIRFPVIVLVKSKLKQKVFMGGEVIVFSSDFSY